MKKWLTIALAAISFTTLTAQASTEVKIGMSGRYFPFTFVKQGKLQGFEVDVWKAIGQRNDYDVKFVTANFSGLFGQLETGRIDTISNQITVTEKRKEKYLFSDPYVIDGAQLAVKKGNDTIHGLADLKGKSVAVNLGSNFEQLLRAHDKDGQIDIRTYDSSFEQDVALGRVDAFVMDRLSILEVIRKSGLPLQLAGQPFETIENAWPFLKNPKGEKLRDEVNQALKAIRADGTLKKISEKWFGSDITQR
ncbi:putative amino-acid-binding protein YxeM precursor [Vibrio aerogenes CECT 7868]|uniref:Putative amino-acid-binding protein YxeM n=1 Tax=Vibrio aerogenes CECT 7868 TaxID=1216006 RepID=A0A1M5ZHN8_9VIBR|nr:amino acid ABC transporter substrate-binding protein [Vibrio aerogenes]SHI23691.1 putative amino-acid-binding protein YxeM precursor [Vibrio aerogenes CECT 7868]